MREKSYLTIHAIVFLMTQREHVSRETQDESLPASSALAETPGPGDLPN